MLETGEVTNERGANTTIEKALEKGSITKTEAKIMKAYMQDYINAE